MTLVRHRVAVGASELVVLQPAEAAELPDDGPVEWAPLQPYWSVLWRSGVALAREAAVVELAGLRVVELGCGLGVPGLAAARAGARVLATDVEPDALDLVERSARENGLGVETLRVDWRAPAALVARGPFDLVLAADVLYERSAVGPLLALLPHLGGEAWVADPGRPAAAPFLTRARERWSVATAERDGVGIHRLSGARGSSRPRRRAIARSGNGPSPSAGAARSGPARAVPPPRAAAGGPPSAR